HNLSLAFNYTHLFYKDTMLFGEAGRDSIDVFALGAEWRAGIYAARLGFNFNKAPFESASGRVGIDTRNIGGHTVYHARIDLFNAVGLPDITEKHLTAGLGVMPSSFYRLDFSLIHAFKEDVKREGSLGASAYSYKTEVALTTYTLDATFYF